MAGHFMRVVRGNFDQAVRTINRIVQSDPQRVILRGRPFHEKPWQRRRREADESRRRRRNVTLYSNLRVILARKARGF